MSAPLRGIIYYAMPRNGREPQETSQTAVLVKMSFTYYMSCALLKLSNEGIEVRKATQKNADKCNSNWIEDHMRSPTWKMKHGDWMKCR